MLKTLFLIFLFVGAVRSVVAFNQYKKDPANAGAKPKNLAIKALSFGFTSFETLKPVKKS